jgi:hypothetical protein
VVSSLFPFFSPVLRPTEAICRFAVLLWMYAVHIHHFWAILCFLGTEHGESDLTGLSPWLFTEQADGHASRV